MLIIRMPGIARPCEAGVGPGVESEVLDSSGQRYALFSTYECELTASQKRRTDVMIVKK